MSLLFCATNEIGGLDLYLALLAYLTYAPQAAEGVESESLPVSNHAAKKLSLDVTKWVAHHPFLYFPHLVFRALSATARLIPRLGWQAILHAHLWSVRPRQNHIKHYASASKRVAEESGVLSDATSPAQ